METGITTGLSLSGPVSFVCVSSVALILEVIILVGAVFTPSQRTLSSVMALQLIIFDSVASCFNILWFITKLSKASANLSCQLEGVILFAQFSGWLVSSLMLSYYEIHSKIKPNQRVIKTLIFLQYTTWLVPASFGIYLGIADVFSTMPAGYCSTVFVAGSALPVITRAGYITLVFFGFLFTGIMFLTATKLKRPVTREFIETPDPVLIPRGYMVKIETDLKTFHQPPPPPYYPYRTALLIILNPLAILICFLPNIVLSLVELTTNRPRSPTADAIAIAITMLYKLVAPVTMLRTNTTIRHKTALLLRLPSIYEP